MLISCNTKEFQIQGQAFGLTVKMSLRTLVCRAGVPGFNSQLCSWLQLPQAVVTAQSGPHRTWADLD